MSELVAARALAEMFAAEVIVLRKSDWGFASKAGVGTALLRKRGW